MNKGNSIKVGGRLYFISEEGVVSNESGFVYKPQDNGNGYKYITLGVRSIERKNFYVHRLVAEVHIPNPLKLNEVNHKDGNRSNNSKKNLEWITRLDNILDYRNKGRARYIARKPVIQFSIEGKEIKEWDSSRTAAKYFRCSKELIQMAASPTSKAVISAKGFKWLYKEHIGVHHLKKYLSEK